MISGSWRKAPLRADANERVSLPTSRWAMTDLIGSCTYSIGSSTVMICSERVLLILSIMAAKEVDLPEPVAPVTNTNPSVKFRTSCAAWGKPNISILGISVTMTLKTSAEPFIVWRPEALKRCSPITNAKSMSPVSINLSYQSSGSSRLKRSCRSSSVMSIFSKCWSEPWTLAVTFFPAWRWKSEMRCCVKSSGKKV